MGATRRLGPSFAVSFVWHVIVLAIVIVVARSARGSHEQVSQPMPSTQARIVWLDQPGPGGGGGGGGNGSQTPPRPAQARGRDPVSVPVAQPRVIEPRPLTQNEPEPVRQVVIPARSLASALDTLPGAIEGVGLPSTLSRGPGDGDGSGSGRGSGDGPDIGSGLGPGRDQGTGGGVYRIGNGVTSPVELQRATPRYTTAAMQARVQGAVIVECVVSTSGVCTDARVVRSLDSTYGLDQEAVTAAGQWRFRPGTRQGRPVPVLVTMEITFTLR
jgi:periplasmic protein TonB